MKAFLLGTGMFLILISAGAAQVIENPDKPKSTNAGRVIVPKEILSIEDDGNRFFFKNPRNIKIGPDGSIFVTDTEQILQFDKDGRFLRNLFKKGQGPGETNASGNYDFYDGEILIHSLVPPKMIQFDRDGKFLKDAALVSKNRIVNFFGRIGSKWVFETYEFPRKSGEISYVEQPHTLIFWNKQTNELTPSASFDVTVYAVSSSSGGAGYFGIGNFIAVPFQDHFLAIVHQTEYSIKLFDVETGRVVKEFRRAYRRVPPPPLKKEERAKLGIDGKTYEWPDQKYANDVSNILIHGDRIWAVTSTVDKEKGILIDEFDGDGVYQDAFYLKLPELNLKWTISWPRILNGDTLLLVDQTEEGACVLKKYALK